VTAIDILLEPDATMLRHAEANNARLLGIFPKGFAAFTAPHDDPATDAAITSSTSRRSCRR